MSPIAVERALETLLLGVIALSLARLAIEPGVRRRFRAFPGVQSLIVGTLALYVGIVAAMVVAAPALLRPAAALALVVLAVERWQARPGYGRDRGLPPGSLTLLPISPWRDPLYYARQATRHGPVFKFRHSLFPVVGIVEFDRAADFLRRHDDSLLVPPAPFNSLVPGGFVRYLDGDRHRDVATVLRSAITSTVVEACEPALAAEARSALERLATKADGVADPLPAIDRMVLHDMMRTFYGVLPGPRLDHLEALYRVADYRRLARVGRRRAGAAISEIVREVRELGVGPAGDSHLARPSFLTELVGLHPDLIANDEILGNFVYTLQTARIDVNGLLVWLIAQIGEHPDWLAQLAKEVDLDPVEASRPDGLADRIVRETLRLHQSEFLMRRVTRPIRWDGFEIPAGWHVRICVQESHRSHGAFDDPDRFDPDRFLRPQSRTRYSPFGMHRRLCHGEHLTRAIGRRLLAELATGYELRVVEDGPQEFSGFHWRPSSRLRVRLTPRARSSSLAVERWPSDIRKF